MFQHGDSRLSLTAYANTRVRPENTNKCVPHTCWFLFWWNVLVVGNGSLTLARRKPPLPACKSCCDLQLLSYSPPHVCTLHVNTHKHTQKHAHKHAHILYTVMQMRFSIVSLVHDKASRTWPACHMSAHSTQIFISALNKKHFYQVCSQFKLLLFFLRHF